MLILIKNYWKKVNKVIIKSCSLKLIIKIYFSSKMLNQYVEYKQKFYQN